MKGKGRQTFITRLLLLGAMAIAFLGGMIGIMNFHSDVDMPTTHKIIYRAVTGKENDQPLAVSIPYSIGLGIGFWLLIPDGIDNQKESKMAHPKGRDE